MHLSTPPYTLISMTADDTPLDQAIDLLTNACTNITDPAARFKTAGEMLEGVPGIQTALGHVRRDAVNEMRATGRSYASVAEELGVSRGRIQQIVEGRTENSRKRRSNRDEDAGEQGTNPPEEPAPKGQS